MLIICQADNSSKYKSEDGFYSIICLDIYLSDFVKTWPLGFRLAPSEARVQASPASKIVEGLASWSVQLHSPGTALTAGGWIRPGGQN